MPTKKLKICAGCGFLIPDHLTHMVLDCELLTRINDSLDPWIGDFPSPVWL